MKKSIYFHIGLPKTGTTALQKGISENIDKLRQFGWDYPVEFRDSEGWAHHDIALLAANRPDDLVAAIKSISSYQKFDNLFFSSESFSNILNSDDGNGHVFFSNLISRLSVDFDSIELICTIRRFDDYVISILIQNILFDGLSVRPSIFASHSLAALKRVMQSLIFLEEKHSIHILEYDKNINQKILQCVTGDRNIYFELNSVVDLHHKSPSFEVLIFFMWFNLRGFTLDADFHSYMRFSDSSRTIIREFYDLYFRESCDIAVLTRKFDLVYIESSIALTNFIWSNFLSFKSGYVPRARESYEINLREFWQKHFHHITKDSIHAFDCIFDGIESRTYEDKFLEFIEKLLVSCSSEMGGEFEISNNKIVRK